MSQIPLPSFYGTLFVATVMLAFLVSLALLSALTFVDSGRGQQLLRAYLGKRLAAARMFSMLEHRQVAPLTYIQKTDIADIRAQLRICRNCSKQDVCDEALGYVGWRHRNFSFCPNRRAIERLIPHY